MLDLVGIGADRRRPLRQYSKGMVQRVGIAQALVNDPELVILDEPMSGLDPVGRREVRELIMKLRDEGRTVLFSSHILSDAELLCSRVGILAKGKLVASGALTELTAGGRRGNEVVASNVDGRAGRLDGAARLKDDAHQRRPVRVRPQDRGSGPEPFIAALAAAGASLVSVQPLRTSLEDVFMERCDDAAAASAWSPGTCSRKACAIACCTASPPLRCCWSAVRRDRPDHGGPGRQDHQGLRPGDDRDSPAR